jgi:hypothetical protein
MFGGSRLWVLPNPSGLNAHHQPAQPRTCSKAPPCRTPVTDRLVTNATVSTSGTSKPLHPQPAWGFVVPWVLLLALAQAAFPSGPLRS